MTLWGQVPKNFPFFSINSAQFLTSFFLGFFHQYFFQLFPSFFLAPSYYFFSFFHHKFLFSSQFYPNSFQKCLPRFFPVPFKFLLYSYIASNSLSCFFYKFLPIYFKVLSQPNSLPVFFKNDSQFAPGSFLAHSFPTFLRVTYGDWAFYYRLRIFIFIKKALSNRLLCWRLLCRAEMTVKTTDTRTKWSTKDGSYALIWWIQSIAPQKRHMGCNVWFGS